MNKRIRELFSKSCWDEQMEVDIEDFVNVEKFADLIVKECADIAYAYDAPKMSGPGMIIAGRIESQFGVEE